MGLPGLYMYDLRTADRYWSKSALLSLPWPQSVMPSQQFQSIHACLHVVEPSHEDETDGHLSKLKYLLNHMKNVCQDLFQPFQKISVDDRMVGFKGRSGLRKYMPNKPNKWGYKSWVAAD